MTRRRLFAPWLFATIPSGVTAAQSPDTPPGDTLLPNPAGDAYLDETARRLVAGARAARDTSRLAIDTYTAVVRERLGVEAPGFRRDRPWVSGERAARIRWSRTEPDVVRVLGSRFRHPGLAAGDTEFSPGLRPERFAAHPLGDPFDFGVAALMGTRPPPGTVHSPIESSSERFYQFRSGDTLTLRLGDGKTVRAVAVTAIPRHRSIRLVSAILWIDPDSHGLARVAYRLAKKVDREMSWRFRRKGGLSVGLWANVRDTALASGSEASSSEASSPDILDRLVGGVINQSMPKFEMDITTVVADYALWGTRHWLPRSVRWAGYVGVSDGVTAAGVVPPSVPMTVDWTLDIEEIRERGANAAAGTPVSAAQALRFWSEEGDSVDGETESDDPAETVTITPADREDLATSDLLPPSFWEEDRGLRKATLAEMASELEAIGVGRGGDASGAASPWFFSPPGKTLRLLRYNPVERLSVGTRLRRDFGWGNATLTARIATARLALPALDITLQRLNPRRRVLFSAYRALRSGDPGARRDGSPGFHATGDAEDFLWSHGAAVRILPSAGDRNWLSLRLFAEHDADVVGDAARDRVGASLGWRPWWGRNDAWSVGGGGSASVRGAVGDHPHIRALVEAALVVPLPDRMSLGMQAGAARVWGDPAPQDLWKVGRTGDWLRGHEDTVRADRIVMGRLDLQRPVRFFRLSLFGDWASVGDGDLCAVGAGFVWMDGIMRLDLAHGLRLGGKGLPAPALRLHLLGDAFF